ncbi:hypothetical protein DICSQDRAFT_155972, partial [Dichomitus squalens LYAD-421 SS1]
MLGRFLMPIGFPFHVWVRVVDVNRLCKRSQRTWEQTAARLNLSSKVDPEGHRCIRLVSGV